MIFQESDNILTMHVWNMFMLSSFFFQLPKGRYTGGKVINSSSDKRITLNLMVILKCLCKVFKHQIEKR